jgi:hypothetical protein
MSTTEDAPAPLTPQAQLVLDYLKSGRTLTNLIAMTSLRVYALPRRISDLTKAGHEIIKQRKTDHLGATYVAYSLKPAE